MSWKGRRVLVTGHTGFKGAWLVEWLRRRGAEVTGYALAPDTTPNLFDAGELHRGICSILADVRALDPLLNTLYDCNAEVVFHLAAQPIVREAYRKPVDTFATNVMGTVNVLEAVRQAGDVRAVVVITSDKCYDNTEREEAYREDEPLGGRDPYSASKACAEIVTRAYRSSYFEDGPRIATVRAGNVIGGGDWAKDRLVPDLLRAFAGGEPALIRNPDAVRPWQHVLEPLHGYLLLAERLLAGETIPYEWNFGPEEAEARPVRWIADRLAALWGEGASWTTDANEGPHEARTLKVDATRARTVLGWQPRLDLETTLQWIVDWHRGFLADPRRTRSLMHEQIARYESGVRWQGHRSP